MSEQPIEFSIDKAVIPPPIISVTKAIDNINVNIPGEIVISEQGKLLKKYFEFEGFTGDLLDAYNNWITKILPKQVNSRPFKLPDGSIAIVKRVHYKQPSITTATNDTDILLPNVARIRGLTYQADITGDLELIRDGQTTESQMGVPLGKIPVMLRSILCHLHGKTEREINRMGECPKDPHGYFIIKGTEKLILIQEKLRVNRIFLFNSDAKGKPVCKMTCSTIKGSTVVVLSKNDLGGIRLNLHFIGKDNTISVLQVFRLLGINDTQDMLAYIVQFTKSQWIKRIWFTLQPSFLDLLTVGDDIEDISEKRGNKNLPYDVRRNTILTLLQEELFPQMAGEPLENKLYLLSMMTA